MPNPLFRQAQYIAFTNTFAPPPSESKISSFGDVRKCCVFVKDYYPLNIDYHGKLLCVEIMNKKLL